MATASKCDADLVNLKAILKEGPAFTYGPMRRMSGRSGLSIVYWSCICYGIVNKYEE